MPAETGTPPHVELTRWLHEQRLLARRTPSRQRQKAG